VILLLYFGSFVKITGDNSQLIEILLCGWNNSARIFGQCAARKGYGHIESIILHICTQSVTIDNIHHYCLFQKVKSTICQYIKIPYPLRAAH
jgi:hypothetical protein